jgi:hypothetical protein
VHVWGIRLMPDAVHSSMAEQSALIHLAVYWPTCRTPPFSSTHVTVNTIEKQCSSKSGKKKIWCCWAMLAAVLHMWQKVVVLKPLGFYLYFPKLSFCKIMDGFTLLCLFSLLINWWWHNRICEHGIDTYPDYRDIQYKYIHFMDWDVKMLSL